MKIVIFYHSMDQHGGAPKVYAQMASYWADVCGHNITILTHYGSNDSTYPISDKVKIVSALPNVKSTNRYARSLNAPRLLFPLFKILKEEKPDFVILNNAPYYALSLGTFACKMLKIPFVIWSHAGYYMKSSPMYKAARKVCFPMAKAVVLLTNGDKNHIVKLNQNTFVIKNPSPEVQDIPLSDNNIALFIGRMTAQKSIHHLLQAWKMVSPAGWRLHIVGEGELKKYLQEYTSNLGISDSVIFFGERKDVGLFYTEASFFVMSSMHEGLPMVLIEALSHGLPLISYNCPYGPADVIDNDKNGFLVPNGNIESLAGAIRKMISSPELREKFSKHSWTKTSEFSMQDVSRRWDSVFDLVMKKK